ncbi:efflux transporter outer membrane subunit [Tahibacter sp.]|uniref:efflux transporter outer membrane subunit n=1 Tax=Tahibacter sp. TaxID=2056211 RepID=UPI0028C49EBE|nr:efflux transporter outer membrane subunit [Tahibacter sp.]
MHKFTASRLRFPTLSLLALALSACAVGPEFVRPTTQTSAAFARADASVGADTSPVDLLEFWRGFEDAQLTALVETALAENHYLKIALARYDQANALLRGAKFDQFPTVTANAEAAHALSSADQAPGLTRAQRDGERYSAGIAASWELDLFGRIRRGVEASRADAAASAADLQAVQVAVVGEVARTYVELRGLQERLRVAQENAGTQRETLRLVDTRVNAGRGTGFDTARVRAQLEATQARVPALEGAVAVALHRLAVLTGRPPAALIADFTPQRALPSLPARLDPGTPGDVLRRRPDVVAAEYRLHAATARIGVATADLFPRFTLGGLLGTQAIDSSALFEGGSATHLVALGIDWSFLDLGRVNARIAAADAQAVGELANYRKTVLLALEDTENALVRYAYARREDAHLDRAAIDSAEAARLARLRFDAGAADLLEVLDAERTRLQAQDAFADARTRSIVGAIGVYKALAGGWPGTLPLREPIAGR